MPSSIKENTHLLSQEIKRNLQQSDVTRAFTAFYDTMRHSEHFKHFFESEAQMDELILKQAKNFYDSLNMDDATFKKTILRSAICMPKCNCLSKICSLV